MLQLVPVRRQDVHPVVKVLGQLGEVGGRVPGEFLEAKDTSILNCILKLTSASPNADIFSRSVLRAAELDPRGHKRAVDAHHLLCLAVAMWVRGGCWVTSVIVCWLGIVGILRKQRMTYPTIL